MYVNMKNRNSQLVRSYSVIPSGSPRVVSPTNLTRNVAGSAHGEHSSNYKRPSVIRHVPVVASSSNFSRNNSLGAGSGGPRLPPLPRLSSSSRNSNEDQVSSSRTRFSANPSGLSVTSISLIHGLILIAIMISSLIAFICSLLLTCDQHLDLDCNSIQVTFWTVITILSATLSFLIYFLHLVGQCDQMITKVQVRKLILELILTFTIFILMMICLIQSILRSQSKHVKTDSKKLPIIMISILSYVSSEICFIARIIFLIREIRINVSKSSANVSKSESGEQDPEFGQNSNFSNMSFKNKNSKASFIRFNSITRGQSLEMMAASGNHGATGGHYNPRTNGDILEDEVFIG